MLAIDVQFMTVFLFVVDVSPSKQRKLGGINGCGNPGKWKVTLCPCSEIVEQRCGDRIRRESVSPFVLDAVITSFCLNCFFCFRYFLPSVVRSVDNIVSY